MYKRQVKWRKESGSEHKGDVAFTGYDRDTFIIDADVPRFGSGEAKGIIKESVRGKDLYLMVDVCNYSLTYSLTGNTNHMSPDDHFQNLKMCIRDSYNTIFNICIVPEIYII